MPDASPDSEKLRRAHPLAIALIARLRTLPHARVLEIGTGSGRNTGALRAAGFRVDTVADGAQVNVRKHHYDGALSTHALLHGTPATIVEMLGAIARSLKPAAPLHATFGSIHDARYGQGQKLEQNVYVSESGDERDIPHAYFDESALRELLGSHFTIESLQETAADEIIGRWAHREPLHGVVHWFVRCVAKAGFSRL